MDSEFPNGILSQQRIARLVDAAAASGLAEPERRRLLFEGIPPNYVLTLPVMRRPLDQVRSDLGQLNETAQLLGRADPPLVDWLRNAAALAGQQPEMRIFSETLAALEGRREVASVAPVVFTPVAPLCNLPPQDPRFVGRRRQLARLAAALERDGQAAITQAQAITGLGGVGKSQLALEYAWRYLDRYDLVWWVPAESVAALDAAFVQLAQAIQLPSAVATSQRAVIDTVVRWLQLRDRWLLIFDDGIDPRVVEKYRPVGRGHIIITTRRPRWPRAKMLRLNVLAQAAAVDLLRKVDPRATQVSAKALALELGFLPLALSQAAAYIEETGLSVDGYRMRFARHQARLLGVAKDYDASARTVLTTWTLAFAEVAAQCPDATDLINLLAWFGSEPLPIEQLVENAHVLPHRLATALTDDLERDGMMRALMSVSLLQRSDRGYLIHRLVQLVTRERMAPRERSFWLEGAETALRGMFPSLKKAPHRFHEAVALLPHVEAVATHAQKADSVRESTIVLLHRAGLVKLEQGHHAAAEHVFLRNLSLCKRTYGEEHENVATTLNVLGRTLRHLSRLDEAEKAHREAMRIDTARHGDGHPKVADALEYIGDIHFARDNLEAAAGAYREALHIDELARGRVSTSVAGRLDKLAGVLRAQAQRHAAERMYRRALEIQEEAYGLQDPRVAGTINNLALVLIEAGDGSEAEDLLRRRSLAIYEGVYGPNHRYVARTRALLGQALLQLEKHEQAVTELRRAVAIEEAAYGRESAILATMYQHLGAAISESGDPQEGRRYMARSHEITRLLDARKREAERLAKEG